MPIGRLPMDRLTDALTCLAQIEDVAALSHRDAKSDRGLAVHAVERCWRVDEPAADFRYVAEADHAAASIQRHIENVGFVFKRA